MFRKKLVIFSLVFSLLIFSTICVEARSKKAKDILKIGSVGPDGVAWANFCKGPFTKTIERVTNGEVTFVWYWGCIMGDEEDFLAKMRIDQLQGAQGSVQFVIMACPDLSVLSLPFLFNNADEVDHIRKVMRPTVEKYVFNSNHKLLLWFEQDFDLIFSTKYEIKTLEDMRKTKFITYELRVENSVLKALGVRPIYINAPEIASSFRAGVADSMFCPAMWWLGTQLYTITKAVTTPSIRYSTAMVMITKKSWDRIPKHHQIAIDKELPDLEKKFLVKIRRGNKKALQAMIDYGIKEIRLSNKELDAFRAKIIPMYYKLADKAYPKKLLDEILAHLKCFRSKK